MRPIIDNGQQLMLSVEAMEMEKAAKDWDRGVGIRMDHVERCREHSHSGLVAERHWRLFRDFRDFRGFEDQVGQWIQWHAAGNLLCRRPWSFQPLERLHFEGCPWRAMSDLIRIRIIS